MGIGKHVSSRKKEISHIPSDNQIVNPNTTNRRENPHQTTKTEAVACNALHLTPIVLRRFLFPLAFFRQVIERFSDLVPFERAEEVKSFRRDRVNIMKSELRHNEKCN